MGHLSPCTTLLLHMGWSFGCPATKAQALSGRYLDYHVATGEPPVINFATKQQCEGKHTYESQQTASPARSICLHFSWYCGVHLHNDVHVVLGKDHAADRVRVLRIGWTRANHPGQRQRRTIAGKPRREGMVIAVERTKILHVLQSRQGATRWSASFALALYMTFTRHFRSPNKRRGKPRQDVLH